MSILAVVKYRLAVVCLALPGLCGLACQGEDSQEKRSLRDLVVQPPLSGQFPRDLIIAASGMRPEDELWLIGELGNEQARTRYNAAVALGESKSEGSSVALYLVCLSDEDESVRKAALGSLGRLGARGKPWLVRILAQRGISPLLLAALAQSSGIKPRPSRFDSFYVDDIQGREWWDNAGKQELGHIVSAHDREAGP